MKKAFSIAFVALFISLVVFFTAFSIFGKKSDFSVKENRALQTLPEFSLEAISDGTFQEQYDDYLSDQFEFRDFWVTAKTKIMLALGKKDMNGVYLGSDGYIIEKYTEADFDEDNVNENIDLISGFLNRTAELEIGTFVSFVPSKGTVLSNRLPKNALAFDSSFVQSGVQSKLSKGVRSIDLVEPLKSHQDEYIFFKTDHHWTALGAYYAYEALSDELGFDALPLDSFEAEDVTTSFVGSSFDKIQLGSTPDTVTAYKPKVNVKVNFHGEAEKASSLFAPQALEGKSKYEYFLGGNYARVDIKTDADSDSTLLIVKDSYTNAIVPFLANHFKKIILIDMRFFTGDLDQLIYDDYSIDNVLVLLNTEKFMQDPNMTKLEFVDESEYLDQEEMDEQEKILSELEEEEKNEKSKK